MKVGVWCVIVSLLTPIIAHATTIAVSCPEKLTLKSTVVAPDGWETIPPRWEPSLAGITVYDGPPNNMASQVPDELPSKGDLEINRYVVGDGFWLECRYHGTLITLAQPLPPGIKFCHAYYKRQEYGLGPLVRFECE